MAEVTDRSSVPEIPEYSIHIEPLEDLITSDLISVTVTTPQHLDEEQLIMRLHDIHHEQVSAYAEREVQLQALVETLERLVEQQTNELGISQQQKKKLEQSNVELTNTIQEHQQKLEDMKQECHKIEIAHKVREQELCSELKNLRQEKETITRRYYHHAFLAVKLKLRGVVNFDINEMVELAITENVQDDNLNLWLAGKLGLRE